MHYIQDFNQPKEILTDSPIFSPLSAATLSETAMAEIRRGWVQIMLHVAPRAASISDSRMYCGTWVVLPQPVSPEITTTCSQDNQTTLVISHLVSSQLFHS
jgi:hypothetical protein